ncbi:MAG: LysR substrate-binding domain-containing protein [Pseudomonadota bacterium]
MSRRLLPPLNPLRVFEVVARTENLTVAARQLSVTQSAVSRQIGVLEDYLGFQLIKRERHGVALTQLGKAYSAKILPAFEMIADATESLGGGDTGQLIRIGTYTTFAAKWLIPRLPNFRNKCPDIEVRIINTVPEVDFDRDPVDAAIQFGNGRWPGMQVDLMFHDEIEPVCSPQFLAQYAPNPRFPTSLLRQNLLVSRYRKTDWDEWLAARALQDEAAEAGRMTFNSTLLCWQAAIDGLGIAIGQPALVEKELRMGQLVRPFKQPVLREQGYYLLRPLRQREGRSMGLFKDWLMSEAPAAG